MNGDTTSGPTADRTGVAPSTESDPSRAHGARRAPREQRVATARGPRNGRVELGNRHDVDSAGGTRRAADAADQTRRPAKQIRRAVPWLIATTLAVVATLLTVATVNARAEIRDAEQAARDQDAALTVAKEVCDLLLNLRAENAAADLDSMRHVATGNFAAQLETLHSAVGALLKQGDVRSSGAVASAGLDTFSSHRATVLVAARTVVTNTELPNGEPRDFRIEVALSREDEHWKVSAVEFLS